jgi:hypothetical protein
MNTGKLTPWLVVAILLVVLFVGYSIYAGLPIKKIGIPGLFSVEFGERTSGLVSDADLSKLNVVQREESQARLEEQLSSLEKKLDQLKTSSGAAVGESAAPQGEEANRAEGAASAVGTAEPAPPVDVTGTWYDAAGYSYIFQQAGNYVAFQELNPLVGVSAVGEGTIDGRVINLSLTTILGEALTADLEVSEDGQAIGGTVTSPVYGDTLYVEFFR